VTKTGKQIGAEASVYLLRPPKASHGRAGLFFNSVWVRWRLLDRYALGMLFSSGFTNHAMIGGTFLLRAMFFVLITQGFGRKKTGDRILTAGTDSDIQTEGPQNA